MFITTLVDLTLGKISCRGHFRNNKTFHTRSIDVNRIKRRTLITPTRWYYNSIIRSKMISCNNKKVRQKILLGFMRLLLALASRTRSELLDNRWLTDKSRTPMLAQSTSEKCLCEDMVLRLCSRSQFYSCFRLIADFSFASRHDVCRTVNKVFQMALMSLEFVIFPEGIARVALYCYYSHELLHRWKSFNCFRCFSRAANELRHDGNLLIIVIKNLKYYWAISLRNC